MAKENLLTPRNRWRNSDILAIPVIKARVLGVEVVRGFARLCDLARISYPDIYDAKSNPSGTQRDLSPKHARDAYEYIRQEELAFWPEIFLALREKKVFRFRAIEHESISFGIAEFNLTEINNSEFIDISRIDGNHRLHFADGDTDGYPEVTKHVSFCLSINLTLDEEIKLFRDINNNQRRMNTSHLDNIKLRLSSRHAIERSDPMLFIANRLKIDSSSPFSGIIYDGGRSDVEKFIPLRTIKTGIEYMFSRPTGLTALDDVNIQAIVVRNYFSSLKKWQPEAWKYPKDYLLLRGAGLWGACFLGAEIIDRALRKGKYRADDMLRILKSGPDWDWSKRGPFQGLSGRSGAVKIRDMVVAELADEGGVSLKAVMRQIAGES